MIYFIQEGADGPIKIGYSFDPVVRCAALQAGNPRPLTLLAAIEGDRRTEATLHVRFALHNLGGEWFDATTPGLATLIGNAPAAPSRQPLKRAHIPQAHRAGLCDEDRERIIAAATNPRDRVALSLVLDYGLRSGSLRAVRFRHFDRQVHRLQIAIKGGATRDLAIPVHAFWLTVDELRAGVDPLPDHFLLPSAIGNQHQRRLIFDMPMSNRACHYWWYRHLASAGIVPKGATTGCEMDAARLLP